MRRERRQPPRWREATAIGLAGVALLCGIGTVTTPTVPSLRTVLVQSFTKMPIRFTELYFTGAPAIDGGTVAVPVTVVDHSSGVKAYQVKVDLTNDKGKVLASATAKLVPQNGRAVPITVRVPLRSGATTVLVTLPGHPQNLHYRIAGSNLPSSRSTR